MLVSFLESSKLYSAEKRIANLINYGDYESPPEKAIYELAYEITQDKKIQDVGFYVENTNQAKVILNWTLNYHDHLTIAAVIDRARELRFYYNQPVQIHDDNGVLGTYDIDF